MEQTTSFDKVIERLLRKIEKDKEGNDISGYPDGNDHAISALRYAYDNDFKTAWFAFLNL